MQLKFEVKGMTCAACSARVEKVAQNVSGVIRAEVNLLAGTMLLEAENGNVADAVIKAVRDAGYDAYLPNAKKVTEKQTDHNDNDMKSRIVVSGIFLVVLMYFTMGHMLGLTMPYWYHGTQNAVVSGLLQFLLTLPVVFLNRAYYAKGLKALYHRAPNMDSLIAISSGAALVYGVVSLFVMAYALGNGDLETVKSCSENLYFESAAMILTLITLGKYLEGRAKKKTGDAISKLMDMNPKTAFVKSNGEIREVAIEDVRVGDIVVVRSGGSIPVDGTVISGRGSVDQSALTGESVPIDVKDGDRVAAATINTEGYIEIRADKVGEDTTLFQIIKMVEQAGGSKAPIARLADKISGVFVPIVMSIALVTFSVWMLAGKTFSFSLTMAICVLVISCPCALGLATPVAIMVGTGKAARLGVLFKNAQTLENLHHVDTVLIDKTGTLTCGKPVVTDVVPNAIAEDRLMYIAAALESRSEHPFAKAIIQKYAASSVGKVADFETLPGRGVCGIVDGVKYYGGNDRLMDELGIVLNDVSAYTVQGKTPLYFADENGNYLGMIIAADVLKEESVQAVESMHKMHLNVVMLTGDNRKTAEAIAEKAGIDRVIADVLPGDKAMTVEALKKEGHKVLMVGDGINDAPALVTADIGMAIGTGTDIAIDAADVVLMHDSLLGICRAFELSRATIRNIKQNLFWAFFYNVLGIPLAAGVLYPAFGIQLSPMIGAAAMSFSSVFVVSNALRLHRFKSRTYSDCNCNRLCNKEVEKMTTVIKVDGMMCMHCKARVENVCKAIPGVSDAVVDLEKKCVTVTGNASIQELKKAITDAGYDVIS